LARQQCSRAISVASEREANDSCLWDVAMVAMVMAMVVDTPVCRVKLQGRELLHTGIHKKTMIFADLNKENHFVVS
jgi:hypothetical protein